MYGWGTFDEAAAYAERVQAADPQDRCVQVEPAGDDVHPEGGEGFVLAEAEGP